MIKEVKKPDLNQYKDRISIYNAIVLPADYWDNLNKYIKYIEEMNDVTKLEEQIHIRDEELIQKNQEIMLLNEVVNNLTFNIAFNEYLNTEKETIMYNREHNNRLILTNDGRIKRRADEIKEKFVGAAKWNLEME